MRGKVVAMSDQNTPLVTPPGNPPKRTLDAILNSLHGELKAWLDQPEVEDEKLNRLRADIEGLKDKLGAEAVSGAIKSLAAAEGHMKQQRKRDAAERIAAKVKPLGVRLSPQEPPKKRGPKPKS